MKLQTLRRIVQEVASASDLTAALDIIVAGVYEELHADACSIFLIHEQRAEYILSATKGLNQELVGKAKVKFGEGLIGLVGDRGEPINIEDAPQHPSYLSYRNIGEENYHAFLGVPIISRGELLGVLLVQQQDARFFAEEEEAFLVTLATQVAGEIAKAKASVELAKLNKRQRRRTDTVLQGISGAPGVAIGQAVVIIPPADLDSVPDRPAENAIDEIKIFEEALGHAKEEIHDIQVRAKKTLSVAENALFDAYLRILDSRTLMQEVTDEISAGQWAQGALKRVIRRHVLQFEALDDEYLRDRATDFRDLGRRILAHMQSHKREKIDFPKQTILVSEEVTPTALMEVPTENLAGVISGTGSGNSHVAILARALGLPTVMGVADMPLSQLSEQEIIVDGYNGQVFLKPSAALKKEFRALILEEQQLDEELETLRTLPSETKDGRHVGLFINTGLALDGGLSLSAGAEGVGLYRTEMPFMLRDRFPSEEEQRIMYRQLLSTFAPKDVVMRTLDIGGDKSLTYFPVSEENPFLGWRGIRISLDHPEIFLQQVRAMLQASQDYDNLAILLPMISSVSEVEEATALVRQAHHELMEEGIDIAMPKLGAMIEVPASVYQTFEIAKRVNFISVGSNDLIQYILAVDRNNPRVANLYNGLHPAVLRALNDVCKAGHRAKRPVSICGEFASDPVGAVLLLGMGYDSLSMSARSLLRIKWVVRQFTFEKAKALVKEVLKMDDAIEVRCHMEIALDEAGLGGLIRAGK